MLLAYPHLKRQGFASNVSIIDEYYDRALSHLKKKCDVETVLVARHLERIGDLLGKIGAGIVFMEKGRRIWIK